MAAIREKTIAAFFDFDGIWFHPDINWYIKDVRLGMVGSIIPWKKACRNFELIQKKYPGKQLQECYIFHSAEWDTVSQKDSSNITPPHLLWEVARRHSLRHHDLYIISQKNCRPLLESMNIRPATLKDPSIQTNPFRNITFLTESQFEKTTNEFSVSIYVEQKIKRLLNLLRPKDNGVCNPLAEQKLKKTYDQVFLYYTQLEYKEGLRNALEKYQENLATTRMAIISSYVARVA